MTLTKVELPKLWILRMTEKLPFAPSFNLQILRVREVAARLGISRSTVYEKLSVNSPRYDPDFPRPIKLSTAARGWTEQSLIDWVLVRAKAAGETKDQ